MGFLSKLFGKDVSKTKIKNEAIKSFDELSEKEKLNSVSELIRIGAEDGDAEEQYNLGMMYATGKGPYGNGIHIKNIELAEKWLRKSAEQGHKNAQNGLGELYSRIGDNETAVKYYKMAAENGHVDGIINLAMAYGQGKGVDINLEKSHALFLKAANIDDPFAQYIVGLNYYYGKGVEEDIQKAFQWYRKAAENGEDHAQYEMGMVYEVGGDMENAKKWYSLSAAQGNEKAKEKMKEFL